MFRLSLADFIGIFGIGFGVVILVLDKAGKLKGPMLLVLLAVAAILALPLAFHLGQVGNVRGQAQFSRVLLVICVVGVIYSLIAVWVSPTTAPLATEGISTEPEVVLIAPKERHRYRWIPLQNLQINEGIAGSKGLAVPLFRLENLSGSAVTRVRVTWRILEPVSVRIVFLTSDHFKPYSPTIAPAGSFAPFELHKADGSGFSCPASDEAAIDIPYIQPLTLTKSGLEHSMPVPIAYGYAMRLVATMPRPTNTAPEKGGGPIVTLGPRFDVDVQYRQGDKDYTCKFRVDSEVEVLSDNTGTPQFPEDMRVDPDDPSMVWIGVLHELWGPDNLRALVTFKVSAVN